MRKQAAPLSAGRKLPLAVRSMRNCSLIMLNHANEGKAGRKYLLVRGMAPTSVSPPLLREIIPVLIPVTQTESSLEVQQRFAKEFYETTEDLDP